VNGLDKTINYTKSPEDMAKLVQSLGAYTAAHFKIGQKYPIDAILVWQFSTPNAEGKQFRNVVSIRPR
jgi:hypothetical protein